MATGEDSTGAELSGDTANPSTLQASTAAALHPDRKQAVQYLKLVGLGAAIGIPAAVLAWGFLKIVNQLQDLLWTDLPKHLGYSDPPWYLVLGFPVVGAIIVVFARAVLPGDGGHSPLNGIGGAPTPWQYGPGIALAALGTLVFGAILGPEAPLIALGSVVGMAAASMVKLPDPGRQVLASAGSFSAVSALFGGPLVAGILLLEAGLAAGSALLPALIPGLAAAAIGYVVFVGLGNWGGLGTTSMAVPELPPYVGTRILDLFLAVAVGILVSLLMRQVRGLAGLLDKVADSGGAVRKYGVLLLGGLIVGLLALIVTSFDVNAHEILFSGQDGLPFVLAESSTSILLLVIAAKAIGYGVCLGAGFRGGPVFPAMFIGVAIAMIACQVFDCSITWALVVGAAAGMTAGTGFVFAALLFAMLLAGTAGLDAMPAAVLGVLAAWLTSAALKRRDNAAAEAPAKQALA